MYNLFNKFLSDITPTYMCAGSINPINWLKQPKVFLQFNLSKYWWSYLELQFPALIIFQCQTLQPGMWTNLYALNNFLFYSVLFFLYSYIFCLAKPITPLCWCLVPGYLPALHPTFTRLVTHIAIYLLLDEWYIYIYLLSDDRTSFRATSQTNVGSRKHQITSFHTTSGRRHEYYISAFHKADY